MSRIPSHLATLANGLCGVGSVVYVLAGNKLWAGLLIVCGVGFDGLDGFLARRAGGGDSGFGRWADSVADAVTFGFAPAALIVVHTDRPDLWQPYAFAAALVGTVLVVLAVARLAYFSARGFRRADFLGAPTPQTALAIVALTLWGDVPAFAAVAPAPLLVLALAAAVLMVVPIPFPKIRRGSRLRATMALTGVALVLGELPVQFRPGIGSPLYDLALGATIVASVGLLLYYTVGPLTVARSPGPEASRAG